MLTTRNFLDNSFLFACDIIMEDALSNCQQIVKWKVKVTCINVNMT